MLKAADTTSNTRPNRYRRTGVGRAALCGRLRVVILDRMVNCDPYDAMPRGCPHALASVKVIPQEDTTKIASPDREVRSETESLHLAGIEVPPEHPPPIVD